MTIDRCLDDVLCQVMTSVIKFCWFSSGLADGRSIAPSIFELDRTAILQVSNTSCYAVIIRCLAQACVAWYVKGRLLRAGRFTKIRQARSTSRDIPWRPLRTTKTKQGRRRNRKNYTKNFFFYQMGRWARGTNTPHFFLWTNVPWFYLPVFKKYFNSKYLSLHVVSNHPRLFWLFFFRLLLLASIHLGSY